MKNKVTYSFFKNVITQLSVLVYLVFFVVSVSLCSTWYVAPFQEPAPATHNGKSESSPWNGFGEIVWGETGVKAGDTLLLNGTYKQCLNIKGSGEVGKNITIKPITGKKVVIEVVKDITDEFIPWEGHPGKYITKRTGWGNRFYFFENGVPLLWGEDPQRLVAGSWYLENFGNYYYSPSDGSMQGKTITIPYQVSSSSTNENDEYGIDLNGQKYIVVEGLEIRCCYNAAILLRDGASNIEIKNNTFKYNAVQAINFSYEYPNPKFIGCSQIKIHDNRFERNANGIYFRDGDTKGPEIKAAYVEVFNNQFLNNDYRYCYRYSADNHAIGTQSIDNCSFVNNSIRNCTSNGNVSTAGIYLWCRDGFSSRNNLVKDNVFENIVGACMGQGSGVKESKFEDNVCNNISVAIVTNAGDVIIQGNKFNDVGVIGIYLKNGTGKVICVNNQVEVNSGDNYYVHCKVLTEGSLFSENQYLENKYSKYMFYLNGKNVYDKNWELAYFPQSEKLRSPQSLRFK